MISALHHWWQGDKVLLWTDALYFLLLLSTAVTIAAAWRFEPLREAWRSVLRRRFAVPAMVVLVAYAAVAVVDSLHFHRLQSANEAHPLYDAEVISVLDSLLQPLRSQTEESYSRPFALYGLNRKPVPGKDGAINREYPRLLHGGAHLAAPAMQGRDLLNRGVMALLWTIALWCGAVAVVVVAYSLQIRRGLAQTWQDVRNASLIAPLGPIFLPLLILIALLCLGVQWGRFYHVFGTDKVGVDVLYEALKSVRTGILIGTLTTLVTLPFAIVFGIAAGYFRGVIDDVIQYFYTTLDSIPDVLLIAAMVLVMQAWMNQHAESFESIAQRSDVRLLLLCVVLGITRWTGLCRLLRAQTLQLRELDYVQAARALGVRSTRIMWREILPNLMHLVIITVVMQFSSLVLAEAVLSYIGIGIDPGMYSWGNMINAARLELAREPAIWWSLSAAFVFLFVLVLAANVFSDAVRDAFDPRMRDGR